MFNHCGCSLLNYIPEPLTLPNAGASTCAGTSIFIFMKILETLLQKSCKINDPCEKVIPKEAPDDEYDFVVVGGGSGGSVVAGRLTEVAQEKNWKILLVEAGGDQPAFTKVPLLTPFISGSNIDWNFTTEESIGCLATGGKCSWPRGKVLGGSGVINGMLYLRATKKDIERWITSGYRFYMPVEMNQDVLAPQFVQMTKSKHVAWTSNANMTKHRSIDQQFAHIENKTSRVIFIHTTNYNRFKTRVNHPNCNSSSATKIAGSWYIQDLHLPYSLGKSGVEAGNNEWTYEELLRLYRKSEDNRQIGTVVDSEYHSKGGPWTIQRYNYVPLDTFDFLEAVKQVGYGVVDDLNGKVNNGFSLYQTNNRNGQRYTTAEAFLKPQRNNPNLHIMLNSIVSKIHIDTINGTKTATRVELTYNNKTYTVKAKNEVILAAGAIQTPQLLLLSGIGDKNELDKVGIKLVHDLPAVGKGLEDHISMYLTYGTSKTATRFDWFTVTDYLATAGGPMSSFWMHNVIGRINSSYSTVDDPDGQFFSYTDTKTSWCKKPRAKTFTIIPSVNQPRSKGYITLRTSNIADHPKIVANYFANGTDIKIMIEFIRIAQKIMKAPVLKQKFGLTQMQNQSYYSKCSNLFTFDSDGWWECAIKYGAITVYHPSCSCKMGPALNPESCVNQKLQLHGIENIRVVDASVFPSIVSANIQATVVAVAEKGAELIINKYI